MTAKSKTPLGLLAEMIRSIGFAGELRLGKAAGQAIVEQIEEVLNRSATPGPVAYQIREDLQHNGFHDDEWRPIDREEYEETKRVMGGHGPRRLAGNAGRGDLRIDEGGWMIELRELYAGPPAQPVELSGLSWEGMDSCPRDGTVVLLRWGDDQVSPGWWASLTDMDDGAEKDPFPWAFFDGKDGQLFVNHAVDTELGPTHWTAYRPGVDAMRMAAGQ